MRKIVGLSFVLAVTAMVFAGTASADLVKGPGSGDPLSSGGVGGATAPVGLRAGLICDIDVSGVESWDALSSFNNVVAGVDVAACVGLPSGTPIAMNGIGWDVIITTVGASWQSEAAVYFDDNIAPDGTGLHLRPGAANNAPGSGPFSSGGIIKLADVAIPDIALPDGVLRLEFYESYDDVAGAVDGTWDAPSILHVQVTPEPASMALLALGGLALIRRRR